MAANPASMSLEQFRALPESKPALEYWFGSIVQKPMKAGTAWTCSRAAPNGERVPAGGSLVADSVTISLQRIFEELDQIVPPGE